MGGPAPNRNARRRNIRPDWRTLDADGFAGAVPEWPIGAPGPAESALWAALWRTPQAEAWADLGWVRVVARYARLIAETEASSPSAALLAEIR